MHDSQGTITAPQAPPDDTCTPGRWWLHVVAAPELADCGRVVEIPLGGLQVGRRAVDVVVTDPLLSRLHLAVRNRGAESLEVEDLGSSNGTRLGGQPLVGRASAGHGAVLRLGDTVLVVEFAPWVEAEPAPPVPEVPGPSSAAAALRAALREAARHDWPVLLHGPSGAGKEHATQAIHRLSRRKGPLVVVNVAAIAANLFESELFGHKRGAFSGALADRAGLVREADGGTLLLDEIGELGLPEQAKLLRVLERRLVRAVGAEREDAVDVRFVVATHRDLAAMVQAGTFRADLYARLAVHTVPVPGLDARRPDLLELADAAFAHPDGRAWHRCLTAEAVEALLLQRWSLHLRELQAALLPALLRTQGRSVRAGLADVALERVQPVAAVPALLPADLRVRRRVPQGGPAREVPGPPGAEVLRELLRRHGGSIAGVAQELGRNRRQVYRWLEAAGIGEDEVEAVRRGAGPGAEVRAAEAAVAAPRER